MLNDGHMGIHNTILYFCSKFDNFSGKKFKITRLSADRSLALGRLPVPQGMVASFL